MNKIQRKLIQNGFQSLRNDESGFVLISVIVMCCILFMVAASQAAMVVTENKQLRTADNDLQSFAIAEAGVERAIWELQHNAGSFEVADGWSIQGTTATLTDVAVTGSQGQNVGTYTVSVETFDTTPVISSQASIEGAGEARVAKVKASMAPVPLFQFAVLAEQPITMENNVTIDSYDPDLGDYNANLGGGDRNISENGDVGTLSTSSSAVDMENNATIKGNAQTGAGGGVSLDNNAEVTGEISDDISSSISPVVVPTSLTGLGSSGALSKDKKTTVTLSSGDYKYSSITMENNATLKITGEVNLYVTGNTKFENNATLQVEDGAKLILYTDGNFTIENNGVVNNITKDPTAFQLYATSSCTIKLENNGDVYGLVYAPEAGLQLENNAYVIGAVVVKSAAMENNAGVHYNEDLGVTGPASGYDLDWWRRTA